MWGGEGVFCVLLIFGVDNFGRDCTLVYSVMNGFFAELCAFDMPLSPSTWSCLLWSDVL